MRTVPLLGAVKPANIANNVDLPEPDRPQMATNCPAETVRLTPATAATGCEPPGYVLKSPWASSITPLLRARGHKGPLGKGDAPAAQPQVARPPLRPQGRQGWQARSLSPM